MKQLTYSPGEIMDLSESVIMPREDFIELSTVAFDAPHHVKSAGERIGMTVQTTIVCAAMSGAVVAACWGWAKSMDWLEEKNFQRKNRTAKTTTTS